MEIYNMWRKIEIKIKRAAINEAIGLQKRLGNTEPLSAFIGRLATQQIHNETIRVLNNPDYIKHPERIFSAPPQIKKGKRSGDLTRA